MHSYQSPTAENTLQVSQTTDVLNSTVSHTYTPSGKIRRMPSAIRLRPFQQDTAILPFVTSASEVAGLQYQNTYMLDAPQTPAPSAEIVATLPLFVRETVVLHALPLNPPREKVLRPRNYARALYIPPMILRSREPDEGEVLLGCCTLLMLSIVIGCGLYFFLIHIH